MNILQKFSHNDTQVRTVVKDGGAWFAARDVCHVLDLTDPRKSVNLLGRG